MKILLIITNNWIYFKSSFMILCQKQAKNISVGLPGSTIKIWGKSIMRLMSYDQTSKQRLLFIFIYIYFSCLPFCLGLCLFVSKKRQNGWTDGAQIFCVTSGEPMEGFWMIKFSKIKLNRILISDLLVLGCFGIYCSFSADLHSNIR